MSAQHSVIFVTYRGLVPSLLQRALRPLGALAAGLTLWLSFPRHNLWMLAPVGVALLAAVTWGRSFRSAALLGLLAGWAFFIPVLAWSGTYVGKLPWLALATLQSLYVALMSGLVGWATARWSARIPPPVTHLVVPLGWVSQELARSTTPWGGFPWARLAFSQADSPLLSLASWGGAPLVTAVVAMTGTGILMATRHLRQHAALPALVVAALALAPYAIAAALRPPTAGRSVQVGYVQGNVPTAGLDFNAQRRAVLDNHVAGSMTLARSAPPDLSLLVWPENASDIDPLRNSDAASQIDTAVAAVRAPLLVGAVLNEPVNHNSNVSLLYRPSGGPPERYTKLHPVPFAEYIPYRSFFAKFSPAANLAGNFVAGNRKGAFSVTAPGGSYWALPTICFEVAYDALMREAVRNPRLGGDDSLIVVQTNNATFGFSDESEQQFAISRLRAVEHWRSVVHVSTVGVSGFIAPDGAVTDKSGLFEAASAIGTPSVRHSVTISDRLGPWPESTAAGGFVLLLALGGLHRRREAETQLDRSDPARRGTR